MHMFERILNVKPLLEQVTNVPVCLNSGAHFIKTCITNEAFKRISTKAKSGNKSKCGDEL